MQFVHPDLRWYTTTSEAKRVDSPRCPFATVERCPRFFESMALLGEAGIATRIDPSVDKELVEFWSQSDARPTIREQAASISGSNGGPKSFSNFCPEVSFEIFGLFATSLLPFHDEIDRDVAHQALVNSGTAHGHDWRWIWAHAGAQHYTECPLYSVLRANPVHPRKFAAKTSPPADPWYKRPIGMIGIGLFVSIVAALVVKTML